MIHIRTREQLLDWLAVELKRLGRRSLVRALSEGQVELLGGFNTNPPGWIVRILSRTGSMWNVVVSPKTSSIRVVKQVPWNLWIGGKSPLYQGDEPVRYTYLRHSKERSMKR